MILRFLEPNSDSNKYYTAILNSGKYLFSAWGASGGGDLGGKGGFTSAVFAIKAKTTFYIYVGGNGSFLNTVRTPGGYNGGGEGGKNYSDYLYNYLGGGSGGGATDIRTVPGNWNDTDSLESRILVAGAGGGACGSRWQSGGYGGGLTAGNSEKGDDSACKWVLSEGASQDKGNLGKGGDAKVKTTTGSCKVEGNGGGGGGYRGGIAADNNYNTGGGGGSSFVSGHNGCSKLSISCLMSQMKSGNEEFLSPKNIKETGHSGNGAFIIKSISIQLSCRYHISKCFLYYVSFIIISY